MTLFPSPDTSLGGCVCTNTGSLLIRQANVTAKSCIYARSNDPKHFFTCYPTQFGPVREEAHFCTYRNLKLRRYSVNSREREQFCIGSIVIRYNVNAALPKTSEQILRDRIIIDMTVK